MSQSHSLVERIAVRIYRAVMRLPLPEDAAEASAFPIDNPALRFRRLQVAADAQLRVLDAKARSWNKLNHLLGRFSWFALVVGLVSFLLAAQAARIAFAGRNDPVAEVKAASSPTAGFELPSWKITLAVAVGAVLIAYVSRLLKHRVVHRLLQAVRTRNDFSGFILRRRHIVPLGEDCDILESQLRRLSQKSPRPEPAPSRAATEAAEPFNWLSLRSIRAKIACWLW